MGLLEQAGKMQDDGGKAAKKAAPKAAKASKPKPAKAEKKPRQKRERKQRGPKAPRELPDEYEVAGKAAKFARRLVDFIFNWIVMFGLIGLTASGTNFNPTLLVVGAALVPLVNIVFLPRQTGRTVGMFLSRTTFVNHKGDTPPWIHLTIRSMMPLFVFISLAMLAMGLGELTGSKVFDKQAAYTNIGIGVAFLLVPLADYVVTKIRVGQDQQQTLWDFAFSCWMVKATREETEAGSFRARLEALGDWGEKQKWVQEKEGAED